MMHAVVLWAALTACMLGENDWEAEERSLTSWQEAKALLEAGKTQESAESIATALLADPKSATLWLWKGKVLAGQGDYAGAVEAASRALVFRSDFVEALYNRACWLSKLGDLENAALDIERVVESGGIDRHTMARDADLDALRADPRFASKVPARRLLASAEADSEAFFVDSWWSVVITVTLPVNEDSLEVHWLGEGSVPLDLVRIVENRIPLGVLVERRLEYVFRVIGAGSGEIGPWRLVGGGLEATLDSVGYRFLGAPGGDVVQNTDLEGVFLAPEQRLSDLKETGAVRVKNRVLARGLPGDSLEGSGGDRGLLEIEVRRNGQPEWLAWEFLSAPGTRVAIRREGTLAYEGIP